MKISVIKSANEVVIGSLQITNQKLAKLMITLNDVKNNLKKRRHTHWVRVSFEGMGSIELGDEPMCIGDYDEYPISPDTRMLVPIETISENHRQYVCSTLNTPILLQNKTLTEKEEIIIVYTEVINEEACKNVVNEMLLEAMKKCLFGYQMKVYNDYAGEGVDKALFDKRIQQILNILPELEELIKQQSKDETVEMVVQKVVKEQEEMKWDEESVLPYTKDEEEEIEIPQEETKNETIDNTMCLYENRDDIDSELKGYKDINSTIAACEVTEEEMDLIFGCHTFEENNLFIKEDETIEELNKIIYEDIEEEMEEIKWVKLSLQGNNNKAD